MDRLFVVRTAVDPSVEAMSETSCFAHSVQQIGNPLSVLKELRRVTREFVPSREIDACLTKFFALAIALLADAVLFRRTEIFQ